MKKILFGLVLLLSMAVGAVMASGPIPLYPFLQNNLLNMRGWPIVEGGAFSATNYGFIATPGQTATPGLTGSFVFNDASPTPTPHTVTIKGGVVISIVP